MRTTTMAAPMSLEGFPLERAAALEWTRRGVFDREWDLTADGRPVATLRYLSILPQVLEVVSPAGRWVAVRRWKGIEMTREGCVGPDLRFRRVMLSARIIRRDGTELLWKRTVWNRAWSITDAEGAPLLHVKRTWSGLVSGGRIELEDAGRRAPDIESLVYLGWLLAIRRRHGH